MSALVGHFTMKKKNKVKYQCFSVNVLTAFYFFSPFYFKVKVFNHNNSGNTSFVKHLMKISVKVFLHIV